MIQKNKIKIIPENKTDNSLDINDTRENAYNKVKVDHNTKKQTLNPVIV